MVLEVAFDAAQLSTRHKSGVALRFPRIARIRTDKPAAEADRLAAVMALVENKPPGTVQPAGDGPHGELC
jgi:DNA ligase-1